MLAGDGGTGMREATHDVMLTNPGEDGTNTLVLSGLDVVIPLQADLDGDPEQDDELRLRSLDGRVERILLASDADVTEDPGTSRFVYRFRDVPPGVYALDVRISDQEWAPVMAGILITTKEASWHGKALGSELDAFAPPEPPAAPPPPEDEPEAEEPEGGCHG
jgi:hypothetical protein